MSKVLSITEGRPNITDGDLSADETARLKAAQLRAARALIKSDKEEKNRAEVEEQSHELKPWLLIGLSEDHWHTVPQDRQKAILKVVSWAKWKSAEIYLGEADIRSGYRRY